MTLSVDLLGWPLCVENVPFDQNGVEETFNFFHTHSPVPIIFMRDYSPQSFALLKVYKNCRTDHYLRACEYSGRDLSTRHGDKFGPYFPTCLRPRFSPLSAPVLESSCITVLPSLPWLLASFAICCIYLRAFALPGLCVCSYYIRSSFLQLTIVNLHRWVQLMFICVQTRRRIFLNRLETLHHGLRQDI